MSQNYLQSERKCLLSSSWTNTYARSTQTVADAQKTEEKPEMVGQKVWKYENVLEVPEHEYWAETGNWGGVRKSGIQKVNLAMDPFSGCISHKLLMKTRGFW